MTMALVLTCIMLEESILFSFQSTGHMGIQGQKQILYLSKKISFSQLLKILAEMVRRHSVDRWWCVVINANQIGMHFKSPEEVAVVAHVLAIHQIDAIVAADGPSHLQTKWASVKRAADSKCAWIESIFAKSKLALLLQNNSPDEVHKKELYCHRWSKDWLASNVLDANFLEAAKLWFPQLHSQSWWCDLNGDANGEMIQLGTLLGDWLLLQATLWLVNGYTVDVGACDLDGDENLEASMKWLHCWEICCSSEFYVGFSIIVMLLLIWFEMLTEKRWK